jgi:hypothetical protein
MESPEFPAAQPPQRASTPLTVLSSRSTAPQPRSADDYLDDKGLEREYVLKRKTWQNKRSAGTGPVYIKAGGRCLYRRKDVESWLASRRVEPGR